MFAQALKLLLQAPVLSIRFRWSLLELAPFSCAVEFNDHPCHVRAYNVRSNRFAPRPFMNFPARHFACFRTHPFRYVLKVLEVVFFFFSLF